MLAFWMSTSAARRGLPNRTMPMRVSRIPRRMAFLLVAGGGLYRQRIRNINCSAVKIWVIRLRRVVDRPKVLDEQPSKKSLQRPTSVMTIYLRYGGSVRQNDSIEQEPPL